MPHKILNGAIFIADAHENEQRKYFWDFLCQIENGKINPTQLFLMGDMFDLLVGEITATHKFANKYIKKLEYLAQKFPIYYFEGNHDFNLSKLFLHVKVFSLSSQPIAFESEKGKILLLHGDKYESFKYRLYTSIIRNSSTCKMLNTLNNLLKCKISQKIINNQYAKKLCKDIDGFEKKISDKLLNYPTKSIDYILEGHHHQNKKFSFKNIIYQNFSSFACDKSYFVVQFAQSMKITQHKLRGSNGSSV